MTPHRLFVAWFTDEHAVLDATRAARAAGFRVHDVYAPYAVHGIEDAMGIRRSRLGIACAVFGALGLGLALLFQVWTSAFDWPLNVGGKPMNSFPAFIPVAFEVTVLFAALGTVATLFARARLIPRSRAVAFEGVTTDQFVLALEATGAGFDAEEAGALARRHGARRTALEETQS
jgi:hypothetical protein